MDWSFRRPGENITFDTRAEANEKVDRKKRYRQILQIMEDFERPMSAKEIAVEMKHRGYTDTDERNMSAPRLTELSMTGYVEPIGKAKCEYTGKAVTFYELRKEN